MDQRVVGALRECDTQEQRHLYQICRVRYWGKTSYILASMGKPEVFYAGTVDPQSAYLTNLSVFLTGTWKLFLGQSAGLTTADIKNMADQVFNWTDGNHPQLSKADNGFLDILENGKPVISTSSVFIRKTIL